MPVQSAGPRYRLENRAQSATPHTKRHYRRKTALEQADIMTNDTDNEHADDDGDRGNLLLKQPAAQKRHAHGGEAGDERIEIRLRVVTLSTSRPVAPSDEYWESAL